MMRRGWSRENLREKHSERGNGYKGSEFGMSWTLSRVKNKAGVTVCVR